MTPSPGAGPAVEQSPELRADASAQRVARVYAEALLEEALQRGNTEEILNELTALLSEVAGADPLLRSFFLGGVVSRNRRTTALTTALTGRASEMLVNFLLVLNDHDRLELLRPILAAYRALLEERLGRIQVHVRSAVPLADDFRERLAGQLRTTLEREPILDLTIEPDLLGGIVVQVGDYLYDASVRTRLDSIRNQLVESSSHAIQTGRDRFSSAV
jgi:F-type H+-transporting ATPase subunit delta